MNLTPKQLRQLMLISALVAVSTRPGALAETPAASALSSVKPVDLPRKPNLRQPPPIPAVSVLTEQPDATAVSVGFATPNALSAKAASGVTSNQALTAPVTISYAGSSSALAVSDTGTGKAIQATINNAANSSSALYGQTNGSGAGLTGYNGGTAGPAGKFGVTNAASAQPAVSATTNGTGSAVLATVTNSASPAVYGINSNSGGGVGVRGTGSNTGVLGTSSASGAIGVEGFTDAGYAVVGEDGTDGTGVYGSSGSGTGVWGDSGSGTAVLGQSDGNGIGVYGFVQGAGYGVWGRTTNGVYAVFGEHDAAGAGVHGQSASGRGVSGESTNGAGVYGQDDGNGVGVWGKSLTGSGLAGLFDGNVTVTGTLTVGSTIYTSDRNVKDGFEPLDEADLLGRVAALPLTSWTFRFDPSKRHVGPMAQDFHAAFGLNGDDEKHINAVDLAGVSLAAIQELARQGRQKSAEIGELKTQVAGLTAALETLTARMASLEHAAGPGAPASASLR